MCVHGICSVNCSLTYLLIVLLVCYVAGRQTAHDIAAFAKESSQNAVRVLGPTDFPDVTNSQQPWFVDFYAPVSLITCCHFVVIICDNRRLGFNVCLSLCVFQRDYSVCYERILRKCYGGVRRSSRTK